MPTAQRAPAALLVRRGGERLLFDCAEGTQRQLLRSSVGLVELREVFVTHFHADHVLGLPGMFKTFALRGRELPLEVYGPRGLVDLLGSLKRVVGKLTYELRLHELAPGDVLERDVGPARARASLDPLRRSGDRARSAGDLRRDRRAARFRRDRQAVRRARRAPPRQGRRAPPS